MNSKNTKRAICKRIFLMLDLFVTIAIIIAMLSTHTQNLLNDYEGRFQFFCVFSILLVIFWIKIRMNSNMHLEKRSKSICCVTIVIFNIMPILNSWFYLSYHVWHHFRKRDSIHSFVFTNESELIFK